MSDHISNIINIDKVKNYKDSEYTPILNKQTVEVVNALFFELEAIFPTFSKTWPNQDSCDRAKKNWIKGFLESRISSIEQIKEGLIKCREYKSPFAPSIGQFISWCALKPNSKGLPEVHEAFKIAGLINQAHSDYIHPHVPTDTVIKHAVQQIGSSKFRGMNEKEAEKLFEYHYCISCRQYLEGKIENVKRALENNSETKDKKSERPSLAYKTAMESMRNFLR